MLRKIYIILTILVFIVAACTSSTKTEPESTSETNSEVIEEIDPVKFGVSTDANVPKGLMAGSKAPGFASKDHKGVSFDLYSNLRQGPVVLMFYRGKWCPVCNRHMSNINDSLQFILNKGAQVIAVTPELSANAKEFSATTKTEFPIISDPSNTIMNAFDVTFKVTEAYAAKIEKSKGIGIAENNGTQEPYLPVPATYIIDTDGTIKFVQFDLNYRVRASVADILRNL